MGRTIHDVMGVAERAMAEDWADPAMPRAIRDEMRKNWMRQQAIRAGERKVRRRGALPPPPVQPDDVPVIVEPTPAGIEHWLTADDVRGVFRRLPPGSVDGLREVRLCVARDGDPAGSYDWQAAVIRIYTRRRAADALPALAIYTRIDTLKTLVHEAAHHFDHTFRKRRSRWATGEKAKHEAWAERIEEEQALAVVMPFVEEHHRPGIDELARWIKRAGGAAVDPRPLLFVDPRPLRVLARAVIAGAEAEAVKVAFARELHLVGNHDPARAIVRRVLAKHPDDAGALAVSACLAQCCDRDHATAEAQGRRAVIADPDNLDAWDVLVRGYAMRARWHDCARACEDALAHTPADRPPRWYFLSTLGEAHLHLRAWDAIAGDCVRMRAIDAEGARYADVHEVIALCWQERWADTHRLASRLLAAGTHDTWRHRLAAAKFESAHHLGRPDEAGAFGDDELSALADLPFTAAWAERLQRLRSST